MAVRSSTDRKSVMALAQAREIDAILVTELTRWGRSTMDLVSSPRNSRYIVAIKWAVGKARGGSISESIRDRRATRPPAHFHRNPLGRGQLAVFPRCSLHPYDKDMGASTASPARTAL